MSITHAETQSPEIPAALQAGKVFKAGMKNEFIQQAQQQLARLGHKISKTDGHYGQQTVKLIKSFQKSQQLPATGSIDLVTWKALFSAPSPNTQATPPPVTPVIPENTLNTPPLAPTTPPPVEKQNIPIGVLYYENAEDTLLRWVPLVDQLSTQFQHHRFIIEPLTADALKAAITANKIIFALVDPALYVVLERHYGAQAIATLNARRADQAMTTYGIAIIRKSSRNDLASWSDLKDKTLMAGSPDSWDDWLIAKSLFLAQGIETKHFKALKRANSHQQALFSVKNGFADAAIVAVGTLEELIQSKALAADELTLVGANAAPASFPLKLSSPLYPEWALVSVPSTPVSLATELLVALFQLPPNNAAAEKGHYTGWVPAQNYQIVQDTLKTLQYPSYETVTPLSWKTIWLQYQKPIIMLGMVFLGLVITVLFLGTLVHRDRQMPFKKVTQPQWHRYRLQMLPDQPASKQQNAQDSANPATHIPKLVDLNVGAHFTYQDLFLKLSSMSLVMVISLSLLVYVSNGEARRVYERFQLDKLSAQGEIVKTLIEDFLKEGLPFSFITHFLDENLSLGKFAGFTAFTDETTKNNNIESTKAKAGSTLTIIGTEDEIIYTNAPEKYLDSQKDQPVAGKFEYLTQRNSYNYKMTFPLLDRSNPDDESIELGELVVTIPLAIVNDKIDEVFALVRSVAIGLTLFFILFSIVMLTHNKYRNRRFIEYAFGLTFIVMSGFVVWQLFGVYEEGAKVRTEALAQSLGQRLKAIAEVGTAFQDVEGLDKIFINLQDSAPDISTIALVVEGRILIHPNAALVGRPWQPEQHTRDYIRVENIDAAGKTQLIVIMPWEVVRNQMLRSIKNFGSLFIACSFLAFIFLTAATSFQDLHRYRNAARSAYGETWIGRVTPSRNLLHLTPDLWLTLIQVVWFLAVFADGLNASFLPQFLKQIAVSSNMPEIYGMALFSSFFAAFVLALAPAGRYAETREIKHLLLAGILLLAIGLITMANAGSYTTALIARFISGMGHGIAFIGVQSFILSVAHKDKTTQGSARQVFALNSGLLSGSVIGALIVVYLDQKSIFILGSGIAFFTLLLTIVLLPNVGKKKVAKTVLPSPQQSKLKTLAKDYEFLRTVVLVGSASKVVYNGVVFLGIPLIMMGQNFAQEDIGQALMIFAAATMISNYYVSILVDKMGGVARVLAFGMILVGIGALVVGHSEWIQQYSSIIPFISQMTLIMGIIALGIGNGFVAAPVVTHILDNTQSVKVLGSNFTVAIYRVLERLGHVIGPLIVGQLLILHHQKADALSIVGLVMVLFGLVFYLFRQRQTPLKPA